MIDPGFRTGRILNPLRLFVCSNRPLFRHEREAFFLRPRFGVGARLAEDGHVGQRRTYLRHAFRKEEKKSFDPRSLRTQVVFAVATSIDALAIGITFACTGYATMGSLTWPLVAIGAVSFLGSLLGFALAFRYGARVTRRFKPEILGGLILIAIGVKILIEHLTA